MITKIHRIGNSLSVYIPKSVAERAGIIRGTPVSVRYASRKIIVEPSIPQETLHDLLERINPRDQHSVIDWGPDVGKEIIG